METSREHLDKLCEPFRSKALRKMNASGWPEDLDANEDKAVTFAIRRSVEWGYEYEFHYWVNLYYITPKISCQN